MSWLFGSRHGYRRDWLPGDLTAALTVWAVLVPEAVAWAMIAGLSPLIGLYAAPGALLLYAPRGSEGLDGRHGQPMTVMWMRRGLALGP